MLDKIENSPEAVKARTISRIINTLETFNQTLDQLGRIEAILNE
jgi:hypothetical protein